MRAAKPPPAHEDLPRSRGVRLPHDYLLHGLAPTARRILRHRYRIEISGQEHFPPDGPVVVAGNHMGFVDGPFMAIFAPRPVHALTKREMFHGPMSGFLRQAGQIPVWRQDTDPAAVRTALGVLREGGCIGVFPEGTRGSGEVLSVKGGAAYLALATGAPVLPMVFLGTRQPGGRSNSWPAPGARLVMQYGEPIAFDRQPWPRRQADVRRESERVRRALRDLLETTMARTGFTTPGPLPDPETKDFP